MIICTRCEKPLDPGHRCAMPRRVFFGLMAGAAASFVPGVDSAEWRHWLPDNALGSGDRLVCPANMAVAGAFDVPGVPTHFTLEWNNWGIAGKLNPYGAKRVYDEKRGFTYVLGPKLPVRLRSRRNGDRRIVEATWA